MLVSQSRGETLGKPKRKLTQEELIERAIEVIGQKLETDTSGKPSIGDLIRLFQLQKDLGFDQPKQVTVKWVVEQNEK